MYWVKIAESSAELFNRGNQLATVRVSGRDVVIAKHENELLACTARCPHAGGKMGEGWLDARGHIVCPLHRYRYNMQNGHNSSGEGYRLKTFAIKETDDGVFVALT